MFHALFRDLIRASRVTAKTPVISTIAVLSLALGVAANATIFSVVHAFLLRPLPYPDADNLLVLWQNPKAQADSTWGVSPANYFDWKDASTSFSVLGASESLSSNLTGLDRPEQLTVSHISPELLPELGAKPIVGRLFAMGEGGQGDRPVLLSESLWRNRFAARLDIEGEEITLDGTPHRVAGVLPDSFDHLLGNSELWMANDFRDRRDDRSGHDLMITGRLAPGVSQQQAQEEMSAIAARLEEEFPADNKGFGVLAQTVRQIFPGPTDTVLVKILQAVVFLVLLVACVNVASLLLAKADSRAKEMAVRSALGAGRGRLVGQLLAESLLLAVVAGGLGLMLTVFGVRMVAGAMPEMMPQTFWPRFDGPVVTFALSLSLVAGLIFGIGPALQSVRSKGLREVLVEGGRGGTSGKERKRLLSAFVVAELALALTILIGAAAMTDLFHSRLALDPGFDPDNLLTLQVNLPEHRFAEDAAISAFVEQMELELDQLPGEKGLGFTNVLPRARWMPSDTLALAQRPPEEGLEARTDWVTASPGYYSTLAMDLRVGRWLKPSDRADAPPVVLVNERFVEQHFGPEGSDREDEIGTADTAPVASLASRTVEWSSALGQQITLGEDTVEIVGVVSNITQQRMAGLMPHQPTVYFPLAQRPVRDLRLVVRAEGDPYSLSTPIREAIAVLDPDQPVRNPITLAEHMEAQLAGPAVISRLLFAVGLLALVLAAIGVYGVMAFNVAQQTSEIGIRMALGARPRQILGRITRQGLMLTGLGLLLGIPGGAAVIRVIGTLFEAAKSDGLTAANTANWLPVAQVMGLLTLVGLVACLLPASRATRIDPVAALQGD